LVTQAMILLAGKDALKDNMPQPTLRAGACRR